MKGELKNLFEAVDRDLKGKRRRSEGEILEEIQSYRREKRIMVRPSFHS